MIRINLLGEKIDRTGVYVIQAAVFGAAVFLVSLGCVLFHGQYSSQKDTQDNNVVSLKGQLSKLKVQTAKVSGLEQKEKLLREKLLTIAKLKANKQGPVHVLDELTRAIPERAWLRSAVQEQEGIAFTGVALDNQTISDFMTSLNSSPYFGSAELSYSEQDTHEGVKVQNFSVTVPVRSLLDVTKDADKKKGAESADSKGLKVEQAVAQREDKVQAQTGLDMPAPQ